MHYWKFPFSLLLILYIGCNPSSPIEPQKAPSEPYLIILGIAQDAGYPQAACQKACCTSVWDKQTNPKWVTSLGIVWPETAQCWLFDATPDFKHQLQTLQSEPSQPELSGIFLTHAHIGHYTGLMHLGREVMGASKIPVFAMPRMKYFLNNNGPWSQLVQLKNIKLQPLQADSLIRLNPNLKVSPFLVPHRDEYSETVGFKIEGPKRTILFIPDIDKWGKWNRNIIEEIQKVDMAFIDGTFFKNGEIPGRDMSEIPHPFIEESMQLFQKLPDALKEKVYFIHFNHTNPVLRPESEARKQVLKNGFKLAEQGKRIPL